MKLPLVDEAEVPRAKIVLYLLDLNHRAGKSKARFFAGHGYVTEHWQELAEACLVVEGPLTLRDGVVAQIRSVWFIESSERAARLATAYPLRQRTQI